MKSRVSIIITANRGGADLCRALASACNQTWADTEIILAANGDLGRELSRGRRIKDFPPDAKICISGSSVGAGRNKGMEEAEGDYLFFLDSDDYIYPHCIETLMGEVKAAGDDVPSIIQGGYWRHGLAGRLRAVIPSPVCEGEKEAIHRFYIKHPEFGFPWGKLYAKECFRDIKYPVQGIFEDIRVLPGLLENTAVLRTVNQPLYSYILHGDSLTYDSHPGEYARGVKYRMDNCSFYDTNYPRLSKAAAGLVVTQALYGLSGQMRYRHTHAAVGDLRTGDMDKWQDYIRKALIHYSSKAGRLWGIPAACLPGLSGYLGLAYSRVKNG